MFWTEASAPRVLNTYTITLSTDILALSVVVAAAVQEIPLYVQCPESGVDKDVYFPHACNCSKFYQCANGVPVERECGRDTVWNAEENVCGWPGASNCINPSCPQEYASMFFSNPRDCSYYYECVDGTPVCKTCAHGLHWNMAMLKCDLPCSAGCAEDRETNSSTGGVSETIQCAAVPDLTTYLDPEDCAGFYVCTQGVLYHRRCLAGLYFNPNINICDFPNHVTCKPSPQEL